MAGREKNEKRGEGVDKTAGVTESWQRKKGGERVIKSKEEASFEFAS